MMTQPHKVVLIPARKQGGDFDHWKMSLDSGTPQSPGNYPSIKIDKGNDGSIKFMIANPQGISFDTANPIFIQSGTAKPTGGVDPQFQPYVLSDNGQNKNAVLTLPDTNQTQGQYTYVLNFTGAPPLDPIIDNGGPGRDYESLFYVAAGIAIVAALYFLFIRPLLKRQQNRPQSD